MLVFTISTGIMSRVKIYRTLNISNSRYTFWTVHEIVWTFLHNQQKFRQAPGNVFKVFLRIGSMLSHQVSQSCILAWAFETNQWKLLYQFLGRFLQRKGTAM